MQFPSTYNHILLLVCTILTATVLGAKSTTSLTDNESLFPGDSLVSPSGEWAYRLETDGRITLNRFGQDFHPPASATNPNSRFRMCYENFGSYNTNNSKVGSGPFVLQVQSGVSLKNGNGEEVWAFAPPTHPRLGSPQTTVSVDDNGKIHIKVYQSRNGGHKSWTWHYPSDKAPSARVQ